VHFHFFLGRWFTVFCGLKLKIPSPRPTGLHPFWLPVGSAQFVLGEQQLQASSVSAENLFRESPVSVLRPGARAGCDSSTRRQELGKEAPQEEREALLVPS
jgi:hypothetical protein